MLILRKKFLSAKLEARIPGNRKITAFLKSASYNN